MFLQILSTIEERKIKYNRDPLNKILDYSLSQEIQYITLCPSMFILGTCTIVFCIPYMLLHKIRNEKEAFNNAKFHKSQFVKDNKF